ncbi:MAG: class I SAM-dependent methyltransferase, partial [Planctomycetia bacterium]|nr:class I SAM-dependent methyltransferase [Planctomycetia bacterium]
RGFTWYPYNSLANFDHLERLLKGERCDFVELVRGGPILDVGCGDGELAFFLESLGYEAAAIDHHSTNWNGLRGVTLLKKVLGSSVEIREIDIDAQFRIEGGPYSLALFLGVLYHLKNPFYALSTLARHARYCLLSTRVARFTPGRRFRYHELPMAYLVDEFETNDDPTNYWIFSQAGLLRLFKRSNWTTCAYMTVPSRKPSDPVSPEGDERAFVLLRSPVVELARELLVGWHELEYNAWRWTERRFSVAFYPAECGNARLRLAFTIPEAVADRLIGVTIHARVNEHSLAPESYPEPGVHNYVREVPSEALKSRPVKFEFELDRALPGDKLDARERGIIVTSVALETGPAAS